MNLGELEVLVALIRSTRAKTVVEFGVNVGRTAAAILNNVTSIDQYVGVDVTRDYVPSKAVQKGEIPDRPGELVLGDPRFKLEVRPRGTLDMRNGEFPFADVVFIDGDHSRAVVEHDTKLAEWIVSPGGLIIWHDYHDLGTVDVKDFLHDYVDAGADVRHVEGTWIAYRRIG